MKELRYYKMYLMTPDDMDELDGYFEDEELFEDEGWFLEEGFEFEEDIFEEEF